MTDRDPAALDPSRRDVLGGALIALSSATVSLPAAANSSPSLKKTFDQNFGWCNQPGNPGICFAGMEKGKVLFENYYGHAEIEFGAPIDASTVFHVASISKQFTGFSIALLQQEGKVDLEADIRSYLPWFPDLRNMITVRHLIHNIAGIHEFAFLLIAMGRDIRDNIFMDLIREKQIINLLSHQRSYDFVPGEEYLYSNSGHVLLGKIVEAVSGQSLRAFVNDRILRPLGMSSTLFYDNIEERIPHAAQSYRRGGPDAPWSRAPLNSEYVGATNLKATLPDLIKWTKNFYDPKIGDRALIDKICQPGQLNDGSPVNYAYGLTRARLAGHAVIMHTGSEAGFSAIVVHQPEYRRSFLMIANMGVDAHTTAESILDMWFNGGDGQYKVPHPPASTDALWSLEGNYLEPFGRMVRIEKDGDGLVWREQAMPDRYVVLRQDGTFDLGGKRFDLGGARRWIYVPHFEEGKVVAIEEQQTDEFMPHKSVWKRVEAAAPTKADLEELAGDYYSDELDITIQIAAVEGGLTASTIWSAIPAKLRPGPVDQFDSNVLLLGSFIVESNSDRRVKAFLITSYWGRNLRVRRMPKLELGRD